MAAPSILVPGNFYSFDFLIEAKIKDIVHLGYQAACFRNPASGEVRWGTLTLTDPKKLRVPWIDEEENGLASRIVEKPEDGSIGNMRLPFDRILELGRSFVVYALYCPEKNIRLAYGFDRRSFESDYQSS